MNKLLFLLGVSILVCLLSEAFAQTDLTGKVFVFPRESDTDYVKLIPHLDKPLENFTLCFRAYTDLSRPHSLFSYNTNDGNNELLVYKEKIGEYGLYIGNVGATVSGVEEFASPVHFCTSWESSSGIAEFWVNGKPWVKKGLQKGYTVKSQPSIVIGQEQDYFEGGFEKSQSFVGEIGDLNMWDYVLTTEEIKSVYQGSPLEPNILDWQALNYEMHDYAVIRPRVWH
ncbi:serum amyloid P-component [Phodopus roborovskii]|uniref:Pentraxin family member n=1 Tax=Phodopus roborovskii TaxID=109678 RepID=A0AAU9ZBN4_PHORO|nr:serum amyloid P-component [Phodopus roborovskii]CAH6789517.1 Apcs [Phodopus roborovskii]